MSFAFYRIKWPEIPGKAGPQFFFKKIYFWFETLKKHHNNLYKDIHGHKNPKIAKELKLTQTKKYSCGHICLLRQGERKKTPK